MKKIFLLIVFLSISNLIFSQTQKGTLFFGTSHISDYRSSQTSFFEDYTFKNKSSAFQYGIFVKDNVLLGVSVLNYSDLIVSFPSPRRGNSLVQNLIYRRYFGQKKIKPFAEADLGLKIFNLEELYPQATIRPGVALFLNSNTSLDLSLSFPILENGDLFPEGITPKIGLALRFFLQYDSENESTISAKEMMKRGVLSADFSGSYFGFSNSLLNSDVGLKYFCLNNVYISGGLNFFIQKYPGLSVVQRNFNPRIGIGGYYPLGDFTALVTHANGQKRLSYNKQRSDIRAANFVEAQAKAGLALFWGRQKLEILTGVEFIQYESDVAEIPFQSDRSFVFTVDHEYFVSDKLSINTSISAFPKSQKQSFLSGTLRQAAIYREQYDLNMNVRLKWFINTRNLKKTNK